MRQQIRFIVLIAHVKTSSLAKVTLIIRCGEHLSKNSNIGVHIETCPIFTQKQSDFLAENRKNFKTLKMAKTNFLLQYFSIMKRGFRTK